MASLGSASARRTPATKAAAGPPPGGSSEVKITGRATLRTAPTTTTTVICSGNEVSVRSSSGLPSTPRQACPSKALRRATSEDNRDAPQ